MVAAATEIHTLSLHDALPISKGDKDASKGKARLPPRIEGGRRARSEEHTSELQSLAYLVCRLLLEKKKIIHYVLPLYVALVVTPPPPVLRTWRASLPTALLPR